MSFTVYRTPPPFPQGEPWESRGRWGSTLDRLHTRISLSRKPSPDPLVIYTHTGSHLLIRHGQLVLAEEMGRVAAAWEQKGGVAAGEAQGE